MAEPKQVKAIKGGLNIARRLLDDGEQAGFTAAQRAKAGKKAAELIKSQPQVKASEALGQLMEKGVKRTTTTQADRTRVGGGNIGGASFPAISEADPAYAGKVWGVMDEGTAARLKNITDPDTAWTTMLGSANQLKTNPIVFDKLKRGFISSMKEGNLSDELAGKINHNLALTFGEGADIRDPKIWREANTFEKRSALADVMMGQGIAPSKGGVAIGGEKSGKGVIFKPTDILKRETEPYLLHTEHGGDVPTFAAGPRLFKLEKESVYDPSLHPGFPTLLTGKDYGINMEPTPTEVYLPDWHKRFKQNNPDRKSPGYYDLALGVKGEGLPSQDLNDEYIRHLLRESRKDGGAVDIDAADRRLAKAIESRMAKGGSVDIEAADARLRAAIDARMNNDVPHMADAGRVVKGATKLFKKLFADDKPAVAKPSSKEANELAQKRASLPKEKGGLGLPKNNTAEQRAQAMGYDKDVYHGTNEDFTSFKGDQPIFTTEDPEIAKLYGKNIYPLKTRGEELTISDLTDEGHGHFAENLAKELGLFDEADQFRNSDIRERELINELKKHGIDRLDITDMSDMGGVQTQHALPAGSENVRSRNAAFDPFRRSTAIATSMGVAAPDLLAEEVDKAEGGGAFKKLKFTEDDSPLQVGIHANKMGENESGGVMANLDMKGAGRFGVGVNLAGRKGETQSSTMANYSNNIGDLGVNANVIKPTDAYKDMLMTNIMASYPIGEGRVVAGMHGNRMDGTHRVTGHSLGYNTSLGGGNLNLNVMKPKEGKPMFGAQYNRSFADGGQAFKKLEFMADGGKLVKGLGKIGKKLLADEVPKVTAPAVPRRVSAGDTVNGMLVRQEIPNQSSISASLYDYSTHGVQEVPMSAFDTVGKPRYRSPEEERYTKELARQIQENKELNPLIVVKDAEGHYILEGAHRFDALRELGIDSFPALMVHDLESLGDIAKADGGKIVRGLGKVGKKLLADPENIVQPPSIIIPSKLSKVKEAVRQGEGDYGAKRVERAADEIPNLEKMYQEEALRRAFTRDNAMGLMTINPADFEKYAMPIPMDIAKSKRYFTEIDKNRKPNMREVFRDSNLTDSEWMALDNREKALLTHQYMRKYNQEEMGHDQYLKHLAGIDDGFDAVPFLEINKQEQGLPLMPFISGHEGRHRNRALAGRGEEKNLIQLLPRAELREPFPRRSQEEYIEALKKELEMTGNMVRPEAEEIYGGGQIQQIIRKPIDLPDVYAQGGGAFKKLQWFDGGGAAVDLSGSSEGYRNEPILTEKDWENIKRNAPEVYEWAKQNIKDEASQLKTVKGLKDFALRTGAQYLGGIPDLINLGLMGVDAVADTSLSSEKPYFGSERYIEALKKYGAVGENEFPITETVAGILAPAGLLKKGVKQLRKTHLKEESKKRRGGLAAMSR